MLLTSAVAGVDTSRPALGTFSRKRAQSCIIRYLVEGASTDSCPRTALNTPTWNPRHLERCTTSERCSDHHTAACLPAWIAAMTVEQRTPQLSQLLEEATKSTSERNMSVVLSLSRGKGGRKSTRSIIQETFNMEELPMGRQKSRNQADQNQLSVYLPGPSCSLFV